jgi:hypothetical protein
MDSQTIPEHWVHALKESESLPKRDDILLKKNKKKKEIRDWLLMTFVVPLIGTLLVLGMAHIASPLGQLLGFFGFYTYLLFFFALVFISGLIMLVISSLKPSTKYILNELDAFEVLNKPIYTLSAHGGIEKAVSEVQNLDDLSKQFVLPSYHKKIGSFLQSIQKTTKEEVHSDKSFSFSKISFEDKGGQIQDQTKRIKFGTILVSCVAEEVQNPFKPNPVKVISKDVAKITVAAVMSLSGDWYLALPDYERPETCIEFFCICDKCRRKADPFLLKEISHKKLCPTCALSSEQ